jgi:hypothetical protein
MILLIMLVLTALIVLGIACIMSFERITRLNNTIKDTYMVLDMNFRRRWDMTSDILDIVAVYIKDEEKLNEIKQVHIGIYDGLSRQRKNAINGAYTKALLNLKEVCKTTEDIPTSIQETIDKKFSEIEKIEARIAILKTNYNVAVLNLNDLTERFPYVIMASRMRLGLYEVCS